MIEMFRVDTDESGLVKKIIHSEKEYNMLPDNNLAFITKIDPQYIDMMTVLRQEFISIDEKFRMVSSLESAQKDGVYRCLSLARTKLEEALHYGIKSLCIMGEIKE